MKRHTVGCWLLTEQLRPASLRGSEEEEEEERSLAPLARYSVPLLLAIVHFWRASSCEILV